MIYYPPTKLRHCCNCSTFCWTLGIVRLFRAWQCHGCQRCSVVILIYISMITSKTEHYIRCFWPFGFHHSLISCCIICLFSSGFSVFFLSFLSFCAWFPLYEHSKSRIMTSPFHSFVFTECLVCTTHWGGIKHSRQGLWSCYFVLECLKIPSNIKKICWRNEQQINKVLNKSESSQTYFEEQVNISRWKLYAKRFWHIHFSFDRPCLFDRFVCMPLPL